MIKSEALQKIEDFCMEQISSISGFLEERQINQNSIGKWKLGYFPIDYTPVLKNLSSAEKKALVDIKFFSLDDYGKINYCQFANRVIFPIRDCHNELIALSGRIVLNNKSKAKYTNTVYDKKHHCYGLNLAIPHIRKLDLVFIVEGQMDVITAHRYGLTNTVACGGTALSEFQLGLLARYCRNIVILLDSDDAGKEARERIEEKIDNFSEFVNIRFMTLRKEKDLDGFLKKYSLKEFKEAYRNNFRKTLVTE